MLLSCSSSGWSFPASPGPFERRWVPGGPEASGRALVTPGHSLLRELQSKAGGIAMSLPVAQVQAAALGLEPQQRAKLAALLIESLGDDEAVDEQAIERLWLDEVKERCRQIDAGEVELVPADQVLASLRARAK